MPGTGLELQKVSSNWRAVGLLLVEMVVIIIRKYHSTNTSLRRARLRGLDLRQHHGLCR